MSHNRVYIRVASCKTISTVEEYHRHAMCADGIAYIAHCTRCMDTCYSYVFMQIALHIQAPLAWSNNERCLTLQRGFEGNLHEHKAAKGLLFGHNVQTL